MKHNKWIAMLLAAILAITAMTIAAFAETAADSQTESTVESSTDSPSETTAEESTASSGRSGRGSSANKGKTAEPENAIGKQAARDAALADAGIIADQAGKVKTRISKLEDGTVIYKVSFTSGDLWYSYRIDAVTGEILEKTAENAVEHEAAKAERGEHSSKPETGSSSRHHSERKGDSGSAKKPGSDKKSEKKDGRSSKSADPAPRTDGTV